MIFSSHEKGLAWGHTFSLYSLTTKDTKGHEAKKEEKEEKRMKGRSKAPSPMRNLPHDEIIHEGCAATNSPN